MLLDIQMSDGFLIKEHPSDGSTTWLVEPRRTTSVEKYSGTLQHPSRRDKIGQTLTAFAHFVYEISAKALVFADIQGPLCVVGTSCNFY